MKTRKTLPIWLTGAVDQAKRNATDGLVPVVVLVLAPGRGIKARRFAVVELECLKALLNASSG